MALCTSLLNWKTLRPVLLASIAAACLIIPLHAQSDAAMSATAIPRSALIQPAQLEEQLQSHGDPTLLILQVGSRLLFDEAHIPGAEYAGPASRPEGLDSLRKRVSALPRGQAIVIYCGCCPWARCPNMGPAWRLLHQMVFTHVKALYIADNFGADWVAKGYRVDKSQ